MIISPALGAREIATAREDQRLKRGVVSGTTTGTGIETEIGVALATGVETETAAAAVVLGPVVITVILIGIVIVDRIGRVQTRNVSV